jgi:hypothetical protein
MRRAADVHHRDRSTVERRSCHRHRQCRIDRGNPGGRRHLHLEDPGVLGCVGHLENPAGPFIGLDGEVLVAFADELTRTASDAEACAGHLGRLLGRQVGGRDREDVPGRDAHRRDATARSWLTLSRDNGPGADPWACARIRYRHRGPACFRLRTNGRAEAPASRLQTGGSQRT